MARLFQRAQSPREIAPVTYVTRLLQVGARIDPAV
jgi:hypothetical protein